MTTRRTLLIALGAGALAAPLPCFAQQQRSKVARIGFEHENGESTRNCCSSIPAAARGQGDRMKPRAAYLCPRVSSRKYLKGLLLIEPIRGKYAAIQRKYDVRSQLFSESDQSG